MKIVLPLLRARRKRGIGSIACASARLSSQADLAHNGHYLNLSFQKGIADFRVWVLLPHGYLAFQNASLHFGLPRLNALFLRQRLWKGAEMPSSDMP
jgi:hypothetical protein